MPALWLNGKNYTGGGGNANEQTLTWAEYCALTPEEKMNGTTYYITDVNGDGQSFQPVIFSLEEREIGVWTDGRPLYEKTYTGLSVPTNGSNWVQISSIDTTAMSDIIGCVAYSVTPTGTLHIALGEYVSTGSVLQVDVVGTVYNRTINIITIRYTKTTDQPGSGTWTPQGVPAVHYDGNEKVVGTWFGETLYEKTYTVNLEVNNSNWTSTGIEVGDIDKAISVVAGNNVGTCWNALFCAVDQTYIRLTSPRNGDTISVNWFTLRYTKSTS